LLISTTKRSKLRSMFTHTATSLRLGSATLARGTADEMRLLRDWLANQPHRVLPFTRRQPVAAQAADTSRAA
jgi:hypothetical protein